MNMYCSAETNLFQLQQYLYEKGTATPMAHVNEDLPHSIWTPANEDTITAAVEQKLWSSCDITRELGLAQLRDIKVLHDDQLHPHHYLQNAFLFPDDYIPWMQFAKWLQHQHTVGEIFCITFCGQTTHVLHMKVCSATITVNSGHGIMVIAFCNCGYEVCFSVINIWDGIFGATVPGYMTDY
jgi:hypothetical protein